MMWHIITGEYPPQPGGVSAYTRQVARGLVAAGDDATIWAPPTTDADAPDGGIAVRRLPDCFGPRSLRALDAELNRLRPPQRLLVQYVPHAFGWKGANVPFCRWIATRARDSVWVMFHEVGFPFDARQSPLRNALAVANRVMARRVARSAERLFISIPAWRPMLESAVGGEVSATWLPVPSGIPPTADPSRIAAVRARIADGRPLVGHFGTYPAAIRSLLDAALARLLVETDCRILLIGPRGNLLRDELVARDGQFAPRVCSTGALDEADVSAHLAACDVMLQPYPDGITTRRTSAMAALAHGVAIVSTRGWLTEAIWSSSESIALVDAADPVALAVETERVLGDDDLRRRLAANGQRLYDSQFDVCHTIAALRSAAPVTAAQVCA